LPSKYLHGPGGDFVIGENSAITAFFGKFGNGNAGANGGGGVAGSFSFSFSTSCFSLQIEMDILSSCCSINSQKNYNIEFEVRRTGL
jgi:hypothetical protein